MKCEIIIQPGINCHLTTREEEGEERGRRRRGGENKRRKKRVTKYEGENRRKGEEEGNWMGRMSFYFKEA